jgi:hypothetical protein
MAGFESVELDASPYIDRESLEKAARSAGSFAAIGVDRKGSLDADVWVTDRVTGKAVLRHVHFAADSSDAPAIFALRAVELLHASLLELGEVHPSRGEVPPPAEIHRWMTRSAPPPKRPTREVHAGVFVLGSPGGVPVSIAPVLGFAWRPVAAWAGGIEAWGPALTRLEGPEGSARVDQEAAFAYVRFEPLTRGGFHAFARAGAGASRLGVDGHAAAPYTDQSNQAWSAAAVAGFGLRIGGPNLEVVTGLDTFWLLPKPSIVFVQKSVATTGGPMLGMHVGVGLSW